MNGQLTEERVKAMLATAANMQKQGATEANSPEYAKLLAAFRYYNAVGKQQLQNSAASASWSTPNAPTQPQPQPTPSTTAPTAGFVASQSTTDRESANTPATNNTQGAISGPFTQQQLQALRWQIYMFKMISTNKPIPEHLQQVVFDPAFLRNPPPNPMDGNKSQVAQKIVETAYNARDQQQTAQVDTSLGTFAVSSSSLPHCILQKKISRTELQQRLIVPSAMPMGIDAHALLREQEDLRQARIQRRIEELENLPANLSNDGLKLKALIELKSLKLLERQRQLRAMIVHSISKSTTLATAVDRSSFRRMKRQSLREARQTEKQERNQRAEREKRERGRHTEYVTSIVTHGTHMLHVHTEQRKRAKGLGNLVAKFHLNAAKEEEKRLQKISQERLQALKANDEEAYMKLIKETKDTRVHHLVEQTNQYLKNLTNALQDQKADIAADPSVFGESLEDDEENLDYYGAAHRVQETVTEQSSLLVGGRLKDYQIKGLQWMISLYNNRLNGILADEMGLGKTIQTLSLITYLIEKKKQNGPYLVIVPLSTLTNWVLEFEKWAPAVTKVVFKGGPDVRKKLREEVKQGNFNVLITTYEYIIKDKAALSKLKWVYMIIDEGHRMKNAESKLSTTLVQHYTTRYRLILTGTPLQNDLQELWAILNFILPKIFNSVKSFDEWFSSPFAKDAAQTSSEQLNEEEQLLIIKRLHKVLRPFLLRRLKKDVEAELPDKVEKVIKCRMSALQHSLYEQIRGNKTGFGDGAMRKKALNNLVMQFRKVCNHPYVFEGLEDTLIAANGDDPRYLYRVSGKFELLERILPKFYRTGHRVLIFFQMTAVMNVMEDYVRSKGWKFLRLDGSTKADERTDMLKEFNRGADPPFIFLLSTRAGGLGLNLQTADTVIIFDSDWNPHQDLQAQDRAHRIGQTKEVRIFRLITANSVEENILARAQQKLDMDGKVIQAGKFDNKTSDMEREKLLRSLFGGEDEDDKATDDDEVMTDEQLNEVLARTEEEEILFNEMDAERNALEARAYKGRPLPRLLSEEELPAALRAINVEEERTATVEEPLGRGGRKRATVHYDDGLNEEQWLNALDEGDVEGYIAKKRARKEKREEKKRLKKERQEQPEEGDEEEDEEEERELEDVARRAKDAARAKRRENAYDEGEEPSPPAQRRGRPPKAKANVIDIGDEADMIGESGPSALPETPAGPKKRGRKPKVKVGDDASETPAKRGRKRKFAGVDPDEPDTVSPRVRKALTRVFNSCYEAVMGATVEENGMTRARTDLFLSLPDKKVYPDYYILIKSPIALDMIQHRIKFPYYKTPQAFIDDFHLMFANAMQYNQEGSWVYNDAVEMKKIFDAKIEELVPGGDLMFMSEDEVEEEPEVDVGRTPKRKRSPSPDEEEDDYVGSSSARGKGKGRSRDEHGEDLKPRIKKTKRNTEIPGVTNKYGQLPKIRLRQHIQQEGYDGMEEGEISE
ncbi:hypothetical protein HDV00_004147 [Rhizophlyctis rosea]|nr:hypothetical protein HDV00_004147 [Rhizophlyctis rosea]